MNTTPLLSPSQKADAENLLLTHKDDFFLSRHYNVMLDFDSIIYPILHAMASRPGGSRVSYNDCLTYASLPSLIDGGVGRMLEMLNECSSYEVMKHHAPFEGASAVTQYLHALGVRWHVKTARKPEYADCTRRYLDEHGIPYTTFQCKMPFDKVGECLSENISIGVDDHPEFMEEATPAGIRALSLRWSYNESTIKEHGLRHADNWDGLGQHVLALVAGNLQRAITL